MPDCLLVPSWGKSGHVSEAMANGVQGLEVETNCYLVQGTKFEVESLLSWGGHRLVNPLATCMHAR